VVLFTESNPKIPIKKLLGNWFGHVTCYLMPCECEVIININWDNAAYGQFRRIFVWRDDLADNDRYIWVNYAPCLVDPPVENVWPKEKLCTLINSNRWSKHPLELYSKREEAIDWFEKYHPDEFDFYGIGWDKYQFKTIPWRMFNRITFIGRLLAKKHKCYRGTVVRKLDVLKNYKFAICFENARDIPGYFTEKIFDCFTAGCVPIYWGASTVLDYIPEDCFIDFRNFKNYEELYNFIKNVSDDDYLKYCENITNYINSNKADCFRKEYFANKVADIIIGDMEVMENEVVKHV